MSRLTCTKLTGDLSDKMWAHQNPLIYPELPAQFGPERVVLPQLFEQHWPAIDAFPVRDDDVWLVSFMLECVLEKMLYGRKIEWEMWWVSKF